MSTCTVDGCSRTHKCRGYCQTHYNRWRKHGDPLVTLVPNRHFPPPKPCNVDDCDRTTDSEGLCRMHYRRLQRLGTTDLSAREPKICSECDRRAHAHGFCGLHLDRWKRTGQLTARTDEDRFWTKTDKRGDDECWPWLGSCHPKGHGYHSVDGKVTYAHRYALELHLGRKLVPGAMACHHCDNPPCVNPAHIYEGTAQSNVDDMWRRGRANPGRQRRRSA